MLAFLDNLYLALPAVRVDMFTQRARPQLKVVGATPSTAASVLQPSAGGPAPEGVTRFHLRSGKHGIEATADLVDGELVVQAGSAARAEWVSVENGYAVLFRELRTAGVTAEQNGKGIFLQNYAFRSASAAAAVIMGQPTNGADKWRSDEGLTYKEWERASLAQSKDLT